MNAQVDRCAGQSPTGGADDSVGPTGRASSGTEPAACDAPIIDSPTVGLVSDLEPTGEAADAALCLVPREARVARAIRGAVAARRWAPCGHVAVRPHPMDRRKPGAGRAVPPLAIAARERAADAR
jgi:hypothetical protein